MELKYNSEVQKITDIYRKNHWIKILGDKENASRFEFLNLCNNSKSNYDFFSRCLYYKVYNNKSRFSILYSNNKENYEDSIHVKCSRCKLASCPMKLFDYQMFLNPKEYEEYLEEEKVNLDISEKEDILKECDPLTIQIAEIILKNEWIKIVEVSSGVVNFEYCDINKQIEENQNMQDIEVLLECIEGKHNEKRNYRDRKNSR